MISMLLKKTVKLVKYYYYLYLRGDKYYVQFKIERYRNIALKQQLDAKDFFYNSLLTSHSKINKHIFC